MVCARNDDEPLSAGRGVVEFHGRLKRHEAIALAMHEQQRPGVGTNLLGRVETLAEIERRKSPRSVMPATIAEAMIDDGDG
jgi:hypothetical protein